MVTSPSSPLACSGGYRGPAPDTVSHTIGSGVAPTCAASKSRTSVVDQLCESETKEMTDAPHCNSSGDVPPRIRGASREPQGGVAAQLGTGAEGPKGLSQFDRPTAFMGRVCAVRLDGKLLQNQPPGRPGGEHTARDMAGSNVNGEDAGGTHD